MKQLMLSAIVFSMMSLAFGEVIESKTLNGESYRPTEDTTIVSLVVADGSVNNVITVDEGLVLTVVDCKGSGKLRKAGAGALVIKDVDSVADITVGEGKVIFARSDGVESVTSSAALHLDASKATSVVTSGSGASTTVSQWNDVRGTDDYPYMLCATWGNTLARKLDGYQNGLPFVDLLPASKTETAGARFDIKNLQGDDATGSTTDTDNGPGLKGVWEVFLIVEDNPGGTVDAPLYQSLLTDAGTGWRSHWLRGADGSYWDSSDVRAAGAKNGTTWLDGSVVSSPQSAKIPSGAHLIRVQRSAVGRMSTLGRERTNVYGGMKYGEIVIFKEKLADDLAASISRRLQHKWFGRQSVAALTVGTAGSVEVAEGECVRVPLTDGGVVEYRGNRSVLVVAASETCVISDDASYSAIRIEGEGAKVSVVEGKTLTAESLSGTKTLEKIGAGVLKVGDVDAETHLSVNGGVFEFARSAGVESLAAAAALHLDASKSSSVVTSGSGSNVPVSRWNDVRGTNSFPWMTCSTYGQGSYLRASYQNELPFVDLMPASATESAGARFDIKNLQGDDATGSTTDTDNGPGLKGVWEVFLVVEDNPGGTVDAPLYQSLLTDAGTGWRSHWLRGADGSYWDSSDVRAAGAKNGTTWLDGSVVTSPQSAKIPSGAHLIRVQRSAVGRMSTLGRDRVYVYGGMKYGEIVIFKEKLADDLAASLSRRLQHKWFGRQNLGSLTIGANGCVTVNGTETVMMFACTVARLDVTVGATLHFTPQTVTVAANGVANVTVPADVRCHRGDLIPLLTAAEGLTGADNFASWTIISSNTRYTMKPKVVGTTLYAEVFTPGIIMVVR